LGELDKSDDGDVAGEGQAWHVTSLFLGIAIMTCALISESGRLPGFPTSSGLAAINILLGAIGAALVVPALLRLVARRQYAGAVLAVMGTPLATLLVGGLLVAAVSGRAPSLLLGALGIGGLALMAMALRDLARAPAPALQESARP